MDSALDFSVLAWHLRTTAVLAVVVLATMALRGLGPRAQHRLLALGMVAAVAVPTIALVLPSAWGLEVAALSATTAAAPSAAAIAPQASAGSVGALIVGSAAQRAGTAPFAWGAWLLGMWVAGAGLYLGGIVAAVIGGRSLRRHAAPPPPATQARFQKLCAAAGVNAELCVSGRVAIPIVMGMRSPTVFLPRDSAAWSTARLRAVLQHELGHVEQRDHRWFPIMHALRGLLWFNPLAWVLSRRFFAAAEFSADAAALAGGVSATDYAEQLLGLSQVQVRSFPWTAAAALGRPDVGTRIRRLLGARPQLIGLRRVVPVLMGSAGALICVAVAHPTVLPGPHDAAVRVAAHSTLALVSTVAVPSRANRVELRNGLLVAPAGHRKLEIAAPGGVVAADQHVGHLITPLHAFLGSSGDPAAPLVVAADAGVAFPELVDVLYTAGRAGISDYYLEVEIDGLARAVHLDPPRFPDPTASTARVAVYVAPDGVALRSRPEPLEAEPGLHCKIDAASDEQLHAQSVALCEASPRGVSLIFSGSSTATYAQLTAAIVAMGPPCDGARIIEAGGPTGGLDEIDAPACDPNTVPSL